MISLKNQKNIKNQASVTEFLKVSCVMFINKAPTLSQKKRKQCNTWLCYCSSSYFQPTQLKIRRQFFSRENKHTNKF